MRKLLKLFAWAVLLTALAVILRSALDKAIHFIYPLKYEDSINEAAEEYGLDRYFVMAVIKAESNYNPSAHSGVARGLMQITAGTAEWIAEKMQIQFEEDDIENPDLNIKMGCYYLKHLLERYNDETLALAAYNAGMGNVSEWLEDSECSGDNKSLDYIPFRETREYVKKVNKYYTVYKRLYK